MTKSELISLVPNKPYRMPCCRECMGKAKKDCDDNPLNCFVFYLLNKNTIDKIRENLQRSDKQMRDKLKSLIDTFFCSVDIDKFYAQNQKEKLAAWLRENGVIVPPCKVGEELYCVYSPPHPANPADKGKWYVNKFEVARFHYGVKGLSIEMYGYGTVSVTEIGKTVFLTREEAERALKEHIKDNER